MAAKSYNQVLTKGLQSSLASTSIEDGKLRYTTDTGRLYMDTGTGSDAKRIRIGDVEDSYTDAQIKAILAPLPKIYVSSDTGRAYVNIGGYWLDLGRLIPESVVTTTDKDIPLWIGESTDDQPNYSTDLTYNPKSATLKATNASVTKLIVNGLNVTTSLNGDGTHTIDFAYV